MSIHVRIRELLATGESATRVARALGCATTLVYREKQRIAEGLPPGGPHRPARARFGPWTEERDDLLEKLWAEGLSANQISLRLGAGISRNAVIGRRARLKLPGRASNQSPRTPRGAARPAKKFGVARKPARSPIRFGNGGSSLVLNGEPLPPARDEDVARVSFLDLNEKPITFPLTESTTRLVHAHCKWPVGDSRDVKSDQPLFCGDQRITGLPYCETHAKRAFQPPQPRRPRAPRDSSIPTFAAAEKEDA